MVDALLYQCLASICLILELNVDSWVHTQLCDSFDQLLPQLQLLDVQLKFGLRLIVVNPSFDHCYNFVHFFLLLLIQAQFFGNRVIVFPLQVDWLSAASKVHVDSDHVVEVVGRPELDVVAKNEDLVLAQRSDCFVEHLVILQAQLLLDFRDCQFQVIVEQH